MSVDDVIKSGLLNVIGLFSHDVIGWKTRAEFVNSDWSVSICTSAQVVETSVTNNSSFQNYTHPDDHTTRTTDTPGFKPFTLLVALYVT